MYATDKDRDDFRKHIREGLDEALIEALGSRPSEKAKPPKGWGVALSIGCQELFMKSEKC